MLHLYLNGKQSTLPRHQTQDVSEGLRRALLRRPELFVSTVAEKLMTYAVGRGLEYYDAPAVRTIVRDARANDYRFAGGT